MKTHRTLASLAAVAFVLFLVCGGVTLAIFDGAGQGENAGAVLIGLFALAVTVVPLAASLMLAFLALVSAHYARRASVMTRGAPG